MKLKGIDIFCASQASTAICFSMDQASSSSSVIQLGGRAIDRHNPIIQDSRRSNASSTSSRFINPPCYSQPPINPKTYLQLQKSKKNSSASKTSSDQSKKKIVGFSKEKYEQKRKSTSSNGKKPFDDSVKKYSSVPSGSIVRKSSAKPVDLLSITPPGSSTYLLSDKVLFDALPDYDPVSTLVPVGDKENQKTVINKQEYESASSSSSSSSLSKPPRPPPSDQVVVLRVSLHCKGCEGKLRKHLSRMEGVTSFNIDFAAKKVTVTGDVTPVSVLASVSKVKNAQFWPTVSATPSASPAPCPTKLNAKN